MIDSKIWLPFLTVVVTLAYAAFMLRSFIMRRSAYQLIWGLGFIFFAMASGMEGLYYVSGWNETVVRFWYLCGAVLVAAWLGQGSIHLILPRRYAYLLLVLLLAGSVFAAFRVFGSPLDEKAVADHLSGAPFDKGSRLLTPFFNVYGTAALAGGALYSAWTFWRKRIMFNRMVGCILIAVGAMVIASAGTLNRFGVTEFLYISELVAGLLMFVGYLFTSSRRGADAKPQRSGFLVN